MSTLEEIEAAVTELTRAEQGALLSFVAQRLRESAVDGAFVQERSDDAWDRQIDVDFAEGGRLHRVLEEVRADLRSARLEDLP